MDKTLAGYFNMKAMQAARQGATAVLAQETRRTSPPVAMIFDVRGNSASQSPTTNARKSALVPNEKP